MKIAQIAPLVVSIPPKLYGGTERVVSFLTEELVRQGHDVTLYASGDSVTEARLIPLCQEALGIDNNGFLTQPYFTMTMERILKDAHQYDIVHSHVDIGLLPACRRLAAPSLTTLHGRLDIKSLYPLFREFNDHPFVSISNMQRKPVPYARWAGTVYHGLPKDLYSMREGKGGYLAFIGRFSKEKGLPWAIEIALQSGYPLKIAAKVDAVDQRDFEKFIKPYIGHPLVEYIGEIGEKEKNEFLGNAAAMIFPISWPEPFGLVMIESMACGTPVIATPCGSVPEVIKEGVNGFIFQTTEEAVAAVGKLETFSRQRCREVFEKRFTAEVMASRYLEIYNYLQGSFSETRTIEHAL